MKVQNLVDIRYVVVNGAVDLRYCHSFAYMAIIQKVRLTPIKNYVARVDIKSIIDQSACMEFLTNWSRMTLWTLKCDFEMRLIIG